MVTKSFISSRKPPFHFPPAPSVAEVDLRPTKAAEQCKGEMWMLLPPWGKVGKGVFVKNKKLRSTSKIVTIILEKY